jgi:Xaa-Pro aminopeptidase
MGLSFDTISSTGANGGSLNFSRNIDVTDISAIIHYSPDPKNSAIIDPSKMYLCDSGGMFDRNAFLVIY